MSATATQTVTQWTFTARWHCLRCLSRWSHTIKRWSGATGQRYEPFILRECCHICGGESEARKTQLWRENKKR